MGRGVLEAARWMDGDCQHWAWELGSIIHFQAARQMHIYTFPKHSLLFKFT